MYNSISVYPEQVYMHIDQERPYLCILSEYFCTDVLYCKIIY